MASPVEVAVLSDLGEHLLLSDSAELVEVLKQVLGHDELGVPVIVAIDTPSFLPEISGGLIVFYGQSLNLSKKFTPLSLKSGNVSFKIDVISI